MAFPNVGSKLEAARNENWVEILLELQEEIEKSKLHDFIVINRRLNFTKLQVVRSLRRTRKKFELENEKSIANALAAIEYQIYFFREFRDKIRILHRYSRDLEDCFDTVLVQFGILIETFEEERELLRQLDEKTISKARAGSRQAVRESVRIAFKRKLRKEFLIYRQIFNPENVENSTLIEGIKEAATEVAKQGKRSSKDRKIIRGIIAVIILFAFSNLGDIYEGMETSRHDLVAILGIPSLSFLGWAFYLESKSFVRRTQRKIVRTLCKIRVPAELQAALSL